MNGGETGAERRGEWIKTNQGVATHPDTPDAQVAIMSAKLGQMLNSKPVKRLIGKLGEVIIYRPHDKAVAAYASVLKDAKKFLPLFK